jgi:hypothetical protein
MRRQVRWVSSNVQLPALPEARMLMRNPMRRLAEPQGLINAAVEDVRKLFASRQCKLLCRNELVTRGEKRLRADFVRKPAAIIVC